MPEVVVPTTFVAQETLFLCGPACAQILLMSLGGKAPAGPPTWQEHLWVDVQAQTLEQRPAGAGPGTPTSPAFPTQKCERCSATSPWNCWSTTPPALERVMNLRQGTATFSVAIEATEQLATTRLVATLDLTVAPAALVFGWQHWVVVDGYRYNDPNHILVAGVRLNGVYVRNPRTTASLHYVSIQWWFDRYLQSVPCGTYINNYVVLRAVRRSGPSAPSNIRIIQ
jgi:hypothetical protein